MIREISFKGAGHDFSGASNYARKSFEDFSGQIVRGYHERRLRDLRGRSRSSQENGYFIESANDWLKRHSYRLIRLVLKHGKSEIISHLVEHGGRHKAGLQEIRDHPFKLGLFAIFPDAKGLSGFSRNTFGNQMLYAHRHNVPPKYLNAFVAKAGSPTLIKQKLEMTDVLEPGFKRARDHRAG